MKRAALSPGDLWLFEDINKPPEGIKAGGIVWWHIMGHALITVKQSCSTGTGSGVYFCRRWRNPAVSTYPGEDFVLMQAMKTSLQNEMSSSKWGNHIETSFFCLSVVKKIWCPPKTAEIASLWVQATVHDNNTVFCTQRRIPECVKAVIIAKKRTMQESFSLLTLCFRTQ